MEFVFACLDDDFVGAWEEFGEGLEGAFVGQALHPASGSGGRGVDDCDGGCVGVGNGPSNQGDGVADGCVVCVVCQANGGAVVFFG